MTTFKIGDRVRLLNGFHRGEAGVLGPSVNADFQFVMTLDRGDIGWTQNSREPNPGRRGWWVQPEDIELLDNNITLGVPSIADDLRLKPQARKILSHLKKGLTISPLEAQNVYQVYRLAASVYDLRKAGYRVEGKRKQDAAGHKYMRYSLAA